MLRTEFLEKLYIAEPALSDKDLIPVLSHFWFDGKELVAFNDQIAISVPCKSTFTGAVPGKLLVNLMAKSKAKKVELLPENDQLIVKAASSKIKLALLPEKSFDGIFEMPKVDKESQVPVDTASLVSALENCLLSVGTDVSLPDQLGVTMIRDNKLLLFFSTNDVTFSNTILGMKKKAKLPERVILSTIFCKNLLVLAKGAKDCKLYVEEDHTLFVADGVHLYGRTLHTDDPIPFVKIMQQHLPKNYAAKFVSIPSKLRLVIERAMVIAESSVSNRATTITVADGKMKFQSKSELGEITDSVMLSGHHGNVTTVLDPKLLRHACTEFDKILLQEHCGILRKGDSIYMIASVGA